MIDRLKYLNRYRYLKDSYSKEGKLHRLRYQTEEAFLVELDKILSLSNQEIFLNGYHKSNSINGMLSLLFQDNLSKKEIKDQSHSFKVAKQAEFKKQIPSILAEIQKLKSPITEVEARRLCLYLIRKQIKLEDLPIQVKKDLEGSIAYQRNKNRL